MTTPTDVTDVPAFDMSGLSATDKTVYFLFMTYSKINVVVNVGVTLLCLIGMFAAALPFLVDTDAIVLQGWLLKVIEGTAIVGWATVMLGYLVDRLFRTRINRIDDLEDAQYNANTSTPEAADITDPGVTT